MTKQQKYLLALQSRAAGKPKLVTPVQASLLKAKIRGVKKKKALWDWLAQ